MGGTFNPVHNAHLWMASAALDALALNEVWFMPAGNPPYKPVEGASGEQRLAMLGVALDGLERIKVSDIELRRTGETYTIDTVKALLELEQAEYVYFIGADLLLDLHKWYKAAELARLCAFAVFPRAGVKREVAAAEAERLRMDYGARIEWVDAQLPDISSTALRARVHAGLSIEKSVPAAVVDYIDRERLYDPPALKSRDEMVRILKETLSPKRFQHSMGTAAKAVELAARYDVSVEQADLAGLLHDNAKYLDDEGLRTEANRLGIEYDAQRWENPELLHASVGAAMLRERFGVTDPEVARAVRAHNTGSADMSRLDLVAYLADKIEDSREQYPGLDELRLIAQDNLESAVVATMSGIIRHVQSRGQFLHPDTVLALDVLTRHFK
ncbi:nicotinate-nucleotide adenylyltransferase [Clostridia bacterium]|nr:nicotinate-nucleotide adenylyltransferase [Clostridia bacterium]